MLFVAFIVGLLGLGDLSAAVGWPSEAPGKAESSVVAKKKKKKKRFVYVHDPQVKVVPAGGLQDGQEVTVSGKGFNRRANLVVTLCADKGEATVQADCHASVEGVEFVNADNKGRVKKTRFQIVIGPFGTNNIVCTDPVSAPSGCVISLGEVTANTDADHVTTPISFAAG